MPSLYICYVFRGKVLFPSLLKTKKEKKNVASQARKDHMNYNEKLICFHL